LKVRILLASLLKTVATFSSQELILMMRRVMLLMILSKLPKRNPTEVKLTEKSLRMIHP
jgi:hypothetical protein